MTTLLPAVSVKPSDSIRGRAERQAPGVVPRTIMAAVPALCRDVVDLVMLYLFPPTTQWITEWTEEHGREVITRAVVIANASLNHIPAELAPREPVNLVGLVVDYLRKPDVYGLRDLERTCISKREVLLRDAVVKAKTPLNRVSKELVRRKGRDLVGLVVAYLSNNGDVNQDKNLEIAHGKQALKELIGDYNPEHSLPLDIDVDMQMSLSQFWDAVTVEPLIDDKWSHTPKSMERITELFSLYYQPAGVSANISAAIGKKHGKRFLKHSFKPALQEHGDIAAPRDAWIQFPHRVLGTSIWQQHPHRLLGKVTTIKEKEALVPRGFEVPRIRNVAFCVFVNNACTGAHIFAGWAFTLCKEQSQGRLLCAGNFNNLSLDLTVIGDQFPEGMPGVAPIKMLGNDSSA